MKVIDLSHTLDNQTPVYPGTEKPVFVKANTIENDGFAETKISMYSHVGTHMDAPAHMLKGRKSLDQFNPVKFIGKAVCLDCSKITNSEISLDFLKSELSESAGIEFIILNTGWSKKWGNESYFEKFPTLSLSACEFISNINLKGIGIDAISIDPINSVNFENHLMLLKNEILIIENLCNLESIGNKHFTFCCFPLKFANSDGAPVRAVAIIN